MDDQTKKDLAQIIGEVFDLKFDQAFDRKFDPAFFNSFSRIILPELNKINERIDHVEGQIHDLRIDVLTKMDQVYTEVKDVRIEQSGHQLQHDDIQNDLNFIKSLPSIAHELKKRK